MNVDILMYHGFTEKERHEGIENHHGKHLWVRKFEQQVAFLKEKYNIISLKDLMEFYAEGKEFKERSVLITVDDGYRSFFTLAFPILEKYQAPAAVFVTTDFIDRKGALWVDRVEYAINATKKSSVEVDLNGRMAGFDLRNTKGKIHAEERIKLVLKPLGLGERDRTVLHLENALGQALDLDHAPDIYAPLSWADVRAIHQSRLVAIGSHTCSHAILSRCSHEELHAQLFDSKQRIEEMTQSACLSFSYPNGEKGDFNNATHLALSKLGYRCAFVTVIGTNNKLSNRYELKRLNIHNYGDLGGFKRTLSGFSRYLRNVKKWKFY